MTTVYGCKYIFCISTILVNYSIFESYDSIFESYDSIFELYDLTLYTYCYQRPWVPISLRKHGSKHTRFCLKFVVNQFTERKEKNYIISTIPVN